MPRSEHNHLALPRRDYMNTNAARVPDWKNLYQLAVMEPDPAKLSQRIVDARSVILDRIQETLTTSSHYTERQELSDALNGLRVLRQEHDHRIQRYGEPRQ